ncbi:hypothetical protein A1O3_05534 [Capronia epimyces CBS 606.96]|uniref:Glucose-methanol-choline oxidoreductase N-terminal domain-containing protein n=1 Tax=Capronia epimyces CBS 606.96 TaxID=1182542 RepID=W9YRH4_9EURO|nr:uncharacterized protein A1O3_05534 [Capronia epimyces CBS 606.96]EXJ84859.1 hypothetical protein A1O3_05534 [Capronia epimyces CBS 606.96]
MKVLLSLFLMLASMVFGLPHISRDVPTNATMEMYDYVVVGCGIAGLVVATRLSENANTSVLCIEAGPLDHYEDLIEIPVYIGQQPPGFYEWSIGTVPQSQLDNTSRPLPMGKGVGGGSLINGMIWNRGNQDDFNVWAQLGNPGWDWDCLLPYFQKSETYTPRFYGNLSDQPVTFNAAVHGFQGPMQVSYPEYYWPQTVNWFEALNALQIPTSFDPNGGLSAGGYFLPLSIDPSNQTRSDARRAYHDAAAGRPNYHVLTNAQVGRVIFNNDSSTATGPGVRRGGLRAVGVEILGGRGGTTQTVLAGREVIVAAGAIHSAQLLELSGIGTASLLSSLGIPVLQDLPGVGNNLQDHPLIHLSYPYQNASVPTPAWLLNNSTFNTEAEVLYRTSRTGPWTAKPSTALAFPALSQISPDGQYMPLIALAESGDRYYPSTYDWTLKSGYELQLSLMTPRFLSDSTPAYEILNDNSGGLDLALMRPLSRGTTHITSADPRVNPAVDPRWLVNPFDFNLTLLAMRFNQRILDTPAIQALQPSYPNIRFPPNATSDQLAVIVRAGIGTEYHYSGTLAMMPRELGGVVDPTLIVYGTDNLRVVDTSVFPVIPGGHLQAVAYAVAEKAADIIRGVV